MDCYTIKTGARSLAGGLAALLFFLALLQIAATDNTNPKNEDGSLLKKTLVVTSILEAPAMMRKHGTQPTGNDQFEGYLVDLLDRIAQKTNLSYQIQLVHDNQYGRPPVNGSGNWTGMIGDLIAREADLALAMLTITPERRKVVDFTAPILSSGIAFLMKKVVKNGPAQGPGGEGPASIKTVQDLSRQTKVEYGTITGSMTGRFFKESQIEPYQSMYRFMSSRPHALVWSTGEAIQKVRASDGTYAFIAEKPALDYVSSQPPCDTTVGEAFFPREYGLATPRGSPLTSHLSNAILKLKASGVLDELYNKWYHNRSRGCLPEIE